MKLVVAAIVLSCLTAGTKCDLESGWKGIRVFETTRIEVERILGSPTETDRVETRYESKEAIVRVVYSKAPCTALGTVMGGFKTPEGTVVEYDVVPKGQMTIDDLNWHKDRYSRWEDNHVIGLVDYHNKQNAIHISTRLIGDGKTEFVRTIHLGRTQEQEAKFTCKPSK